MARRYGNGPFGPDFSYACTQLGFVVFLFQSLCILALLLSGNWFSEQAGVLNSMTPLMRWVDGFHHPIFPQSLFSSAWGQAPFGASNLIAYSCLQWMGLGFLLDLARDQYKNFATP